MYELLKTLRQDSGYTQEYVANFLGYKSKSGYCMLENGKVELTINRAKLLATLYQIDVKKFLE